MRAVATRLAVESRRPRRGPRAIPAPTGAGIALCCALLAAPAPASAAPRASLELGSSLLRFDHAERAAGGNQLDREVGFVPGLLATAQVDASRWFARTTARVSAGDVAYEGLVQSGAASLHGLPAESTTGAAFAGAELQLGAWLDPRRRLALYAGGGWRTWDRDIRATTVVSRTGQEVAVGGLHEEYAWGDLHGGARVALLRWARLDLEADGRVVRTVAPALAVRWNGDTVRLRMQERFGWAAGLCARRESVRGRFAAVSYRAERWSFGESATDRRTGLREPAGETLNQVMEARVGARF